MVSTKIIGFPFQMWTFHAKSTFSSFHVCRWNKKCCEIVYFHRKFIENSSIAKACRSTEPPNAMPKSRQIVDTCTLFFTTSRSTEPSNRMPKSRHIVDSCTLLFTTSRSTEAAKHDAQIATNRRIIHSPFYDVQVDRGSQTRCPNRDHGRQKLKKYRFWMNVGRREAANLGTC